MNCFRCGKRTYVVDSRPSELKVRRMRVCKRCGNRFATVEKPVEEVNQTPAWPPPKITKTQRPRSRDIQDEDSGGILDDDEDFLPEV